MQQEVDQSHSPQEQSQPEIQLEEQQQSNTEVVGTEDSDEVAVISAEEPVVESQNEQEPVEAPAPIAIEYNSLNEVDLDSLSVDVRSHVEPILRLAAQEVSTMKAEKESYETTRKEFSELIQAMESSGYDVKPLESRINEQNEFIDTMSQDIINTAWQAFSATHPEFSGIPDNAKQLFSKELERLYERHDGDTVLDRINNAYDYALWRAGVNLNATKENKRDSIQSEQNKVQENSNPNAKKQAVIADGRIATSAPIRSVDELDWTEVLDRHSHLLDR